MFMRQELLRDSFRWLLQGNRDPPESSSRTLGMWLGGMQVPRTSRQHALYEKYRALLK
jgi:hypothetical protein